MERGGRKNIMERNGEGRKKRTKGTGWKGVEGRVQWNGMKRVRRLGLKWNGMERGGRKSTMERDGKG